MVIEMTVARLSSPNKAVASRKIAARRYGDKLWLKSRTSLLGTSVHPR